MDTERAYLDNGLYGGGHVTALRETNTEFLVKARKVELIVGVIDGLEEWDVNRGLVRDYEIGDLKQIFFR